MNEAIRQVTHVQNIRYDKATERLYIIDQTLLPNEEKEIELRMKLLVWRLRPVMRSLGSL